MALVTPPDVAVGADFPATLASPSGSPAAVFSRAPRRTPKSLFLGPAALLAWWIFAVVARVGVLIYNLEEPASEVSSTLILISVSAGLLMTFNLWLLVTPRSFYEASPVWETALVTAMLVFARAGGAVEKALSSKPENAWHSSGVEPAREGAVPLLYVLLVCRLPNDVRAVGCVTAVYLVASALLELHSISEGSGFQLKAFAWQQGLALFVLATLAVLRRHWYVVRNQNLKPPIWSRIALLGWFFHVCVQFSVMVNVSISSDSTWVIFAVGALLAFAGALCGVSLWLTFCAQPEGSKYVELLCVVGLLLFAQSLGVIERHLFDKDVPRMVDVNVHEGPLAMLHVLLVCRMPTADYVAAAAATLYAVGHVAIAFVDEKVARQRPLLAAVTVFVVLRRSSENQARYRAAHALPPAPQMPFPDAPAATPLGSTSSSHSPIHSLPPDRHVRTSSIVAPVDRSEVSDDEVDDDSALGSWSSYLSPSDPPSDTERDRPHTLVVPSTTDVSSGFRDARSHLPEPFDDTSSVEVGGDRPTQPPPRSSPNWCEETVRGVASSQAASSTELTNYVARSSEARRDMVHSKSLQVIDTEQSMLVSRVQQQQATVQVLRTQLARTREELEAAKGQALQRKREVRRLQRRYNELQRSSGLQSLERKLAHRSGRRLNELSLHDLQALDEELDEALSAVKGQLRAELERKTKCQVCLENDTNCAFSACGHQACTTCASHLEVCHICRTPLRDIVILYH